MEHKERSEKDIKKLDELIEKFKSLNLDKKYKEVYEYALNYRNDAEHYHNKEDYFTSFGSANYAYGMLEALIMLYES